MIRAVALAAALAAIPAGQAAGQDAGAGEKIAGQVCVACHGPGGNSPLAANPKIAGQIPEYVHKQLADFKPKGSGKAARPSSIMQPIAAGLSEADMKALAAYYGAQQLAPAAATDKELASLGQKIWRGGIAASGVPACAGCHGPTGAGMPAQYPRIAGQFAEYIAGQLKAFKEGARANDPNGMMRAVAARMSDQEIRAVAQYAAGLR